MIDVKKPMRIGSATVEYVRDVGPRSILVRITDGEVQGRHWTHTKGGQFVYTRDGKHAYGILPDLVNVPEKFDPTKPVQTRDGRKVRIVSTDGGSKTYPVIGFVEGDEIVTGWTAGGAFDPSEPDHPEDLVNVHETTEVFYAVGTGPKMGTLGAQSTALKFICRGEYAWSDKVLKLTFEDGKPVSAELV